MYKNDSSEKNKSKKKLWDIINYFKELPFYNTYIGKPKIKSLKKIDLLSELLFCTEISVVKNR